MEEGRSLLHINPHLEQQQNTKRTSRNQILPPKPFRHQAMGARPPIRPIVQCCERALLEMSRDAVVCAQLTPHIVVPRNSYARPQRRPPTQRMRAPGGWYLYLSKAAWLPDASRTQKRAIPRNQKAGSKLESEDNNVLQG